MKFRQARLGDIPKLVELEDRAWPEGGSASSEQFESRIKTFPTGVIIAEENNNIVGVVVGQKIQLSEISNGKKNWKTITDNGYIANSHRPTGDTLFGVDLSVDPDLQNRGIGRRLLLEIGKLAIKNNLKFGVLGARMPDYHKYCKKLTPEQYVNHRDENGKLIDSELRFYESAGLELRGVIKDYFPDRESLNNGVLAVWK
ncbi:GNAT family N-acetyltransferase, partial [Candidatus Berkelbacteria bacterium]|nr:GNAT family N-acetyltransferase [Candidatus Berkelbacteria bacterium]